MHPFIAIGDRVLLDSWEVMTGIGLLVGGLVAWAALRKTLGPVRALVLVLAVTATAVLGGRLSCHLLRPTTCPLDLAAFLRGGESLFGALGLAALLLPVAVRLLPALSFWTAADAFALGVPAGLVFARIGCYMKGCCWGTPIPEGHPLRGISVRLSDYHLVAVHPVQLYSAAAALLIFVVLLGFRRRSPQPGLPAAAFLLLYGIARFVLEYYRGDALPGRVLPGLTLHQELSLLLVAVGTALLRARTAGALSPRPPR